MIEEMKFKFQKGLSIVEGMTAAAILGASMVAFITLQSTQERDFATLRKFDKAAYAVEFIFEELAAVYNPIAKQYGNPQVFEDTDAGTLLKVKGFGQLPVVGDQIIIEGVGGKYEITARTVISDGYTTLTLDRSDVSDASIVNMASDATLNATITVISNAEGSLDSYNLDLTRYNDTVYVQQIENANPDNPAVALDLASWGGILETHFGVARDGEKREIEVIEINKDVPVDLDNDGITDQEDGVDVYRQVLKKQVTITIKQGNIEEKFRRLYLTGT